VHLAKRHLARAPARLPHRVAPGVQHDREQPRARLEGKDALPVVTQQRTVGAEKGLRGQVLGVARPADAQRDRIHDALVAADQVGEPGIQVLCHAGDHGVGRLTRGAAPVVDVGHTT
jgi:hypothetical protein